MHSNGMRKPYPTAPENMATLDADDWALNDKSDLMFLLV